MQVSSALGNFLQSGTWFKSPWNHLESSNHLHWTPKFSNDDTLLLGKSSAPSSVRIPVKILLDWEKDIHLALLFLSTADVAQEAQTQLCYP